MTSKLTQLTEQLATSGIELRSKQSIKWLLDKISDIRNPIAVARDIKGEKYRETRNIKLGNLYCFYYDPLGKDDLPYYDKFPLVLVLQKEADGFLGLNLHYLPIKVRALFMDKLMRFAIMKDDDIVKLRVTYDILSASKRLREFRPCIKRYLTSHIKSKILAIEPHEFEVASFLPLQQFKGAKPTEVWEESIEKIRNS